MCVSDDVAVGVASGVVGGVPSGGVVFDPADVGGGNTAVRGAYSVVRRWLPGYASVSGRWGGDWCVLRSDVGKGEGGGQLCFCHCRQSVGWSGVSLGCCCCAPWLGGLLFWVGGLACYAGCCLWHDEQGGGGLLVVAFGF